jgi:hypothetical protein
LQVVLVVAGLAYSFWGYLLFDSLWHSIGITLLALLPRKQSASASPEGPRPASMSAPRFAER